MPTPFMHLHMAEQMLTALTDPLSGNGRLNTHLYRHLPAFYFGNIAPDFPAICDFPRDDSHFHHIPPAVDEDPFANMLAVFPLLQSAANLDAAKAVFIAAYGVHLLLDVIWFHDVLVPYFVKPKTLGERAHRRLLHFSLLTYLDQQAEKQLPADMGSVLRSIPSEAWLPFGQTTDLLRWRDLVADQLFPGATSQTVSIFAGRLGMDPDAFAANIENPDWMKKVLLSSVPIDHIKQVLQTAVPRSIRLIANYLHPALSS